MHFLLITNDINDTLSTASYRQLGIPSNTLAFDELRNVTEHNFHSRPTLIVL